MDIDIEHRNAENLGQHYTLIHCHNNCIKCTFQLTNAGWLKHIMTQSFLNKFYKERERRGEGKREMGGGRERGGERERKRKERTAT